MSVAISDREAQEGKGRAMRGGGGVRCRRINKDKFKGHSQRRVAEVGISPTASRAQPSRHGDVKDSLTTNEQLGLLSRARGGGGSRGRGEGL